MLTLIVLLLIFPPIALFTGAYVGIIETFTQTLGEWEDRRRADRELREYIKAYTWLCEELMHTDRKAYTMAIALSLISARGGGRMKEYVLMQEPKGYGGHEAQEILIVDNTHHAGKKRIERLCTEGYEYVGKIIGTELAPIKLRNGIARKHIREYDALWDKLHRIRGILDE